jgi:RNA polymerase sigma factor (sigma-70 family)
VTDSGDAATLASRLFEQHGSAVRRYLRRLTGEPELARDLAQDVYLRVVRSADRYEPREREQAWIFRIARNVFLDHRRAQARQPRIDATGAEWGGAERAGAAAQATRVDLDEALQRLDAVDRDAFLLCELGGLRYEEVAATLDLTVAGVRSRIYRVRLALRAALSPPARDLAASITRPGHDD